MTQTDNTYQDKICIMCEYNKKCKKNKFKKYTYGDRVSYRCISYKLKSNNVKNS